MSDFNEIDWAEVVDLFAFEYGWTIDYIKGLTLGQLFGLLRAMKKRKQAGHIEPIRNVRRKMKNRFDKEGSTKKQIKEFIETHHLQR